MIELILNGNIAEYIDTDELNERIREDIRWEIKDQVSKLIKNDEEFKRSVYSELTKQIVKLHISDDITTILKDKIRSSAEGIDDWAIKHYSGMKESLKEIYQEHPEYRDSLNEKLRIQVEDYKVDNYTISNFVSNLLLSDETYQVKLKELVDTRTEALFDKLAYDE